LSRSSAATAFRWPSCSSSSTALRSRVSAAPARRWLHSSRRLLSADIVQHRHTAENNASTPFSWTDESKKRIAFILSKFPNHYRASAVIPLLYIAQEQNSNWLPLTALNAVAEVIGVAPIRVYEVATFYTMFNRKPVGKYHLQVCGTTPCQLCGFESIRDTISKHLGIAVGETSKDGLFTLAEVECLGACVNAPMMQINNQHFYEFLTPENTIKLLDDLRGGSVLKNNNQNHVFSCEGPQGATSLHVPPPGPFSRDFDALKTELAAKKAEADRKAAAEAAAKAAAAAAPKKA